MLRGMAAIRVGISEWRYFKRMQGESSYCGGYCLGDGLHHGCSLCSPLIWRIEIGLG